MLVLGDGGLGKSTAALNAIRKSKTDFVLHQAHISPLALMLSLKASNSVLHVFDDVVSLWRDPSVLGIVKGACDSLGLVKWEKTVKGSELVELSVNFKGKMLILCNNVERGGNSDVLAVLDRMVLYEHCPSSREVLETAECDEKVIHDLLAGLEHNPFLKYSYRTIEQLSNVLNNEVEYKRRLACFTASYPEKLFQELLDNADLSVSQKAKEWASMTGKDVRTWYRWYRNAKMSVHNISDSFTKTINAKISVEQQQ